MCSYALTVVSLSDGTLFLLSFLLILFPVVLAVVFAFFIIQKSKNLRYVVRNEKILVGINFGKIKMIQVEWCR